MGRRASDLVLCRRQLGSPPGLVRQLPDLSIVYHVDEGDIFKAHKALGHKFCLSGGIPNFLLAFRRPDEVRARCKQVIDGVARDGGYIMDASAIMQNDSRWTTCEP